MMELRRVGWDREAASLLVTYDPAAGPGWLAGEVAAGRVAVYAAMAKGARAGTLAVTVDPPELVLVTGAGGLAFFPDAIIALERLARTLGLRFLRAHSARPGFGRLFRAAGFAEAETVYRKSLS